MIYKYEEIDIHDGMTDTDGVASLDSTVFVSDGGYFKGRVEDHGTLIIRGGEADVFVGPYGRVIAHGGKLHAVVGLDGTLNVHEGNVTIKEEGGYVQANESTARVTYEPSKIIGKIFTRYVTLHNHTQAIDCKVRTTCYLTIHRGGVFTATKKVALIQGTVSNSGSIFNSMIDFSGKVSCTDNSVIKHCIIDGDATVTIASCKLAQGIIVKNGILDIGENVRANCVTLYRHGRLITHQQAYATYRDFGGYVIRHGGTAKPLK